MVAIKKSEADAFAARPDPARLIVLLYGPDAGLVRERAERIILLARGGSRAVHRAGAAGGR